MNKKTAAWIFALIVILIIASVIFYFNRKNGVDNNLTPFEYIKQLGATKTTVANAGDRYDYGNYGFYSNNRGVNLTTGNKGTYDKINLVYDAGGSILIKDIFK